MGRVWNLKITCKNRIEGETIKTIYKFSSNVSRDSSTRTFGLLQVKLSSSSRRRNVKNFEQQRREIVKSPTRVSGF